MKPVIVSTSHRTVLFGYVVDDQVLTDTTMRLERARMAVYWSKDVKSALGLAVGGPTSDCRISSAVPALVVHDIIAVIEPTEQAVHAWEAAPWSR